MLASSPLGDETGSWMLRASCAKMCACAWLISSMSAATVSSTLIELPKIPGVVLFRLVLGAALWSSDSRALLELCGFQDFLKAAALLEELDIKQLAKTLVSSSALQRIQFPATGESLLCVRALCVLDLWSFERELGSGKLAQSPLPTNLV